MLEILASTAVNSLLTFISIVIAVVSLPSALFLLYKRRKDGPTLTYFISRIGEKYRALSSTEKEETHGKLLLISLFEGTKILEESTYSGKAISNNLVANAELFISHGTKEMTQEVYEWLKSLHFKKMLLPISNKYANEIISNRLKVIRIISGLRRKIAFESKENTEYNFGTSFVEIQNKFITSDNYYKNGCLIDSYWKTGKVYLNITWSEVDGIYKIHKFTKKKWLPFGKVCAPFIDLVRLLIDVHLTANLGGKFSFSATNLTKLIEILDDLGGFEGVSGIQYAKACVRKAESLLFAGNYEEAKIFWNQKVESKSSEIRSQLLMESKADQAIYYRVKFVLFLCKSDYVAYKEIAEAHDLYLEKNRIAKIDEKGIDAVISTEEALREAGMDGTGLLRFMYTSDAYQIKTKTILFIIPSTHYYQYGGAETAFRDLAYKLTEIGFKIVVFTTGRHNYSMESDGIKYHFFVDFVKYYSDSDIISEDGIRLIQEEYDKLRLDFVHACSFGALSLSSTLKQKSKGKGHRKTVFSYFETPYETIDGVTYPPISNPWNHFLPVAKNIIENVNIDNVVTFSKSYEDWLTKTVGFSSNLVTSSPHFIILDRVQKLKDEAITRSRIVERRYVFVCTRLVPRKGLLEFLKAFKKHFEEMNTPEIYFVFSAAGLNTSYHPDFIHELLLEADEFAENIRIYKEDLCEEDIYNLYMHCEFVVLPSIYEGYGMVPLEANLCKKAVIAYAIPGLSETLKHNYNSIVITPFCEKEMFNKISELWQNKQFCDQLGDRSIKHTISYIEAISHQFNSTAMNIYK